MTNLRRLLPFVRPYTGIVLLLFITVVLPVMAELAVPRALQAVIDQGIRQGDMAVIWRGSAIMLVAALVGALATLGQGFCRAWLSQGLAYDLRNSLFRHIQSFTFANLDQLQTGQIMTRLSSDVDRVRGFASHSLSLMLRASLMILGSLFMILLIDWQLALAIVLLLPIAGLFIRFVMQRATPLFTLVQQRLGALNTVVQENLAGVQVVKAFVRERFEINRFEGHNLDYMTQHIRVGRLLAVAMPVLTLLTNIGLVAVVWLGGRGVIGGRLTVGELVAFNSYLLIGMAPLLLLSNTLTMVSQAEASATRVLEVLDTKPAFRPAPTPHAGRLAGHVTFENVSFRYDGADSEPVLDGVSFSVAPGQRVALLGRTGSGKSTLVHLIPRFYEAGGGSVCIDGLDVRDWSLEALRSQIGAVLQETTLFSGTVRENIAYGRPEATLAEVMAAAQAAQAHDFIVAMPAGYDSPVEAGGASLSGGQRQRIAIARALLIRPAILILDDSTSAVDLDTEFRIQQALEGLTRAPARSAGVAACTTFVIAQRIHSVLSADQILVLERGRIVAQGAHRELLRSSPIYREIYESQLGNGTMLE